MAKSAFDELKETIIESIRFSKTLTDLKERIETILREYDFEEELVCYSAGCNNKRTKFSGAYCAECRAIHDATKKGELE